MIRQTTPADALPYGIQPLAGAPAAEVLSSIVQTEDTPDLQSDLRPNWPVLACGTIAIALVSFLCLDWPFALASTLLGGLMIHGAEVDARTFLLPDVVTIGACLSGFLASALLDPFDPWLALTYAGLRAAVLFCLLEGLRRTYAWLRGREGLGFGDIKLAAAIGAWLPLDFIPLCFALASGAALFCVIGVSLHGTKLQSGVKLPFGLFLCPALWLIYVASLLSNRL